MEGDYQASRMFSLEVEENLPSKHDVKDRKGMKVNPMPQEDFAKLFASGKLLAIGNIYQTTGPETAAERMCIIVHIGCTPYCIEF
jgi:hypothetical protein